MIILANLAFVGNWFDVPTWSSFALSLSWSNSVDFQCSVAMLLLAGLLRRFTKVGDTEGLAKALRIVLFVAAVASVAICAALFEENSLNIFKLGQASHYGLLQTDNSYK